MSWWQDVEDDRFWKTLLIIGILLNILVVFTSELGLDTHVRMAADEEGVLAWGSTRPEVPTASDPTDGGTVSSPIIEDSATMVKAGALLVMMGLIASITLLIGVRAGALVAIYPTFIFSTGRAYQEGAIALLALIAAILLCRSITRRGSSISIPEAIFGSLLLGLIPFSKGMLAGEGLAWFILVVSILAHQCSAKSAQYEFLRSPKHMGGLSAALVGISMLIMGGMGHGGTLSVIADSPARFASALLISAFDLILVYTLFGMVLWPFIGSTIRALGEVREYDVASLTAFICGFSTALIVYVAALWTYESLQWNAAWPMVTWTMGNNGRYISLIMAPCLLLLARLTQLEPSLPSLQNPAERSKALLIGVLLILPISLLTAVHGQTMWTDEAGEILSQELEDGEDFLFVSETTLGMHWLYTFHSEVDPDDSRRITGHWRSNDVGWSSDLEEDGTLSHVDWLVLSPDSSPPSEGWVMHSSGEVDYLNGGGHWQVWNRGL